MKTLLHILAFGATLALTLRSFGEPVSPARASAPTAADELDAYIQAQTNRLNVPGAMLVVVEGEEIVHVRGFGQARPGGETPGAQTPFPIGSVTKSFTAMAVMQLVEGGKIELDAPVQRYLPWFRLADPEASAQISVRHLLNQTSGLPQVPGMINLANFDAGPDATERQARALAALALTRPVGSAFEYSNLNYNLLGLIVEAAGGESYSDYVQHHIFDPLDMGHSYTSQASARRDGLAVGHRFWFGFPFAAPDIPLASGSLPSGQLISCAQDMGNYLIAHLNAGRYGGTHILSTQGMAELHRPAVEAGAMGISMGHYAMGWFVEDRDGTTIVSHPGTLPDFFAFIALVPEQRKGLVLLINANHVMMDKLEFMDVGMGAAQLLAGQVPAMPRMSVTAWALRAQLLIPVLQVAGVGLTLRRIRRWRRHPGTRPSGARKWGLHVALPLIPNLLVAAMLIPMVGNLRSFLTLFMPDFSWIALISGSFAAIWTFLRTGLVLHALRRPPDGS